MQDESELRGTVRGLALTWRPQIRASPIENKTVGLSCLETVEPDEMFGCGRGRALVAPIHNL